MDATDIQRKYLSREKTRCEIYQQIVDRCFRRLHWSVEQGHTQLIFNIPPWIFGLPRYSIPDCEMYVMDALKHKGFKVSSFGNGTIQIDWSMYLPDPKQVREVVRFEHTEKMRTPRNKLTICDATWLSEGPLVSTNNKKTRQALPPAPNPLQAMPFSQQPKLTQNQVRNIITPNTNVVAQRKVQQWKPPMPSFQQTQINQPWKNNYRSNTSVVSQPNSKASMTIKW